jgi:RNA polymerase primary sigma factor
MSDGEDQLSAYFRRLGEHVLLTPELERQLSVDIEDVEVLTWRTLILRPEMVATTVAFLEPRLRTKFPKLLKVAAEALATKRARRDPKVLRRLAAAAKEAAVRIRGIDLDRAHIEVAVRELTFDDAGHAREVRALRSDGVRLRDDFVRANLRLVVMMARRYDRGGMPLADLIQEGNLGLMHAVPRFDHKRGMRFSTYATWWIRHAIGRALADKARAVRIPVHMLEAQQHMEKVRHRLVGEFGRPPTDEELSEAASIPIAKLHQMQWYIMGQPQSLDRTSHEDPDRSVADTIADPDSEETTTVDDMGNAAVLMHVRRLMHCLSDVERDVLVKRFGLGSDEELTFREIGDVHSLSRERIRQIQNQALDKLKRALAKEHGIDGVDE